MVYWMGILVLAVVCGVFWRMGGAGKGGSWYDNVLDTKWRDIGSALCMFAVIYSYNVWWVNVIAYGLITLGCTSYFNWLNPIIDRFADIEVRTKYWWNFFAASVAIQSSALLVRFDLNSVILVFTFSGVVALGKVLIDEDDNGVYTIFGHEVREDVASEWWSGFANCLLLAVNVAV